MLPNIDALCFAKQELKDGGAMRLNRKKPGLIVALTIIAEATSYPQTGTDHLQRLVEFVHAA